MGCPLEESSDVSSTNMIHKILSYLSTVKTFSESIMNIVKHSISLKYEI